MSQHQLVEAQQQNVEQVVQQLQQPVQKPKNSAKRLTVNMGDVSVEEYSDSQRTHPFVILSGQLISMKSRVSALETRVETLEEKVDTLEKEIEQLQLQVDMILTHLDLPPLQPLEYDSQAETAQSYEFI